MAVKSRTYATQTIQPTMLVCCITDVQKYGWWTKSCTSTWRDNLDRLVRPLYPLVQCWVSFCHWGGAGFWSFNFFIFCNNQTLPQCWRGSTRVSLRVQIKWCRISSTNSMVYLKESILYSCPASTSPSKWATRKRAWIHLTPSTCPLLMFTDRYTSISPSDEELRCLKHIFGQDRSLTSKYGSIKLHKVAQ